MEKEGRLGGRKASGVEGARSDSMNIRVGPGTKDWWRDYCAAHGETVGAWMERYRAEHVIPEGYVPRVSLLDRPVLSQAAVRSTDAVIKPVTSLPERSGRKDAVAAYNEYSDVVKELERVPFED